MSTTRRAVAFVAGGIVGARAARLSTPPPKLYFACALQYHQLRRLPDALPIFLRVPANGNDTSSIIFRIPT